MRAVKLEFPSDYRVHHVGCAISGNPLNTGVFGFTRPECNGHLMTVSGPFADCPDTGEEKQKLAV